MKQRHPHLPTRRLALVCVALACAALLAYAGAAHTGAEASPFALAAEFPRGALVYAQCDDLPALVKQWDESALKQRYLVSVNFRQFQQHHLALKIAARWQEFNDALGFSLDAAALVSATDRRAAVAVYDIGRLDLLFVAPLNAARFAAASFVAARDDFEEVKLPGGDIYYRREVAADRGRQIRNSSLPIVVAASCSPRANRYCCARWRRATNSTFQRIDSPPSRRSPRSRAWSHRIWLQFGSIKRGSTATTISNTIG